MDSVEKLEAMGMEEEEEEEEETLEERYWDVSSFLGNEDLGILAHVSFDPTEYVSITKTVGCTSKSISPMAIGV